MRSVRRAILAAVTTLTITSAMAGVAALTLPHTSGGKALADDDPEITISITQSTSSPDFCDSYPTYPGCPGAGGDPGGGDPTGGPTGGGGNPTGGGGGPIESPSPNPTNPAESCVTKRHDRSALFAGTANLASLYTQVKWCWTSQGVTSITPIQTMAGGRSFECIEPTIVGTPTATLGTDEVFDVPDGEYRVTMLLKFNCSVSLGPLGTIGAGYSCSFESYGRYYRYGERYFVDTDGCSNNRVSQGPE